MSWALLRFLNQSSRVIHHWSVPACIRAYAVSRQLIPSQTYRGDSNVLVALCFPSWLAYTELYCKLQSHIVVELLQCHGGTTHWAPHLIHLMLVFHPRTTLPLKHELANWLLVCVQGEKTTLARMEVCDMALRSIWVARSSLCLGICLYRPGSSAEPFH